MANFNQLLLLGNLTRDPELRYTSKGTAICQTGIAVNRKWKSEDGEERQEVLFLDCKAWGKSAETLSQYTKKGHSILLMGRLQLEQWDDKQTQQKRSKHVMLIESFQFLNNRREGESDVGDDGSLPAPGGYKDAGARAGASNLRQPSQPAQRPADTYEPPVEEDDVPF